MSIVSTESGMCDIVYKKKNFRRNSKNYFIFHSWDEIWFSSLKIREIPVFSFALSPSRNEIQMVEANICSMLFFSDTLNKYLSLVIFPLFFTEEMECEKYLFSLSLALFGCIAASVSENDSFAHETSRNSPNGNYLSNKGWTLTIYHTVCKTFQFKALYKNGERINGNRIKIHGFCNEFE